MSHCNTKLFFERAVCPVCRSHATSKIYECGLTSSPIKDLISSHYRSQGVVDWSLFDGTDYELRKCEDCKLIYQKNVPNDHVLDRIYNEMIAPDGLDRLEEERLTIDNFERLAGELGVLFRWCARLNGKHPSKIRFLDYGFGHGRWARIARALGATVFATETGDAKKAIAAGIGVEIISDDDIDRMRFDIVHTEQVFEHLVDPAGTFKRLSAATDGIFKLAVPHHRNLEATLASKGIPKESPFHQKQITGRRLSMTDYTYISILPLEHLNTYSPKTIDYLTRENGMRVVSTKRKSSVALVPTDLGSLVRSSLKAGAMAAKMSLPRDTGYYLMTPA